MLWHSETGGEYRGHASGQLAKYLHKMYCFNNNHIAVQFNDHDSAAHIAHQLKDANRLGLCLLFLFFLICICFGLFILAAQEVNK